MQDQDETPVEECASCGYKFYRGDEYYDVDDQVCCNDVDCMVKLANIQRRTA